MGKNDKKDKKKGQTMTLSDFVGPNGGTAGAADNLDWAQDQWEDEAGAGDENEQPGVPRKSYARSAGTFGNFREEKATGGRIVDYNMEKPYLGFVANLLTNLPEAEVREFFADADIGIENIKMIYKERSTFAFVEFETPQALQMALLLEGKFLKNRPVKVDIATQDQREKMMNDKARGMLNAAGGANPKSPNSFDRDGMGAEQRSFTGVGDRDRRGPRSNTSANPPRDFGEFSREAMGGAQPEMSSEFGGSSNNRRTPNSNTAASGGGFPNFRDAERVEQPTMERRMPRQGSRDNVSKSASPTTKEGGNWRDAPKAQQQQLNFRDSPASEQPQRQKREDAAPKREGESAPAKAPAAKSLQIGGATQPEAKKDLSVPKPAPAPKVNAWGSKDNGGKGLNFRD